MRKTLVVAGTVALVLAVGACGARGDGKYADADSLARAVSASTAKTNTSKISMDMKMGPMVITAEGGAIYAGADSKMGMTMHMDFGGLGAQAGLSTLDMEARLLDQVMYLKLPENFPGVSAEAGKQWVKLGADQMLPGGGDMGQYLEQSDPTKLIELLKNSGELTDTQTGQSVDGVAATKYTFDVDFNKMIEAYGGSLEQIPGLDGVDLDAIPTEVWIDQQDLPVQMRIDFSEMMQELIDQLGGEDAVPAGMSFDEAYVSMKFTDWGSEVKVTAPSADEISDVSLPGLPN